MPPITDIIRSLRPHQWIKNLLIFAAIIFSGNLGHLTALLHSVQTFVYFCMASGSIYLLNDILDREQDAIHPEKRHRPIAAGKIKVPYAASLGILLAAGSITAGFFLNYQLGYTILTYVVLLSAYSIKLKHVVIVDVLIVAIGFVLRALAGGVAIDVYVSPWLLVCTFFLALFLVLGKRRHELQLLKDEAADHRKILKEYNPQLLDQMVAVVAAICIVAYALYTLDEVTVERFHTTNLIYTIPFVILGIFRYFYLIYVRDRGSRPEKILISDPGIIFSMIGWIITVGFIIY